MAITLLAVQACGSGDGKKKTRATPEAGAGGEGGGTEMPGAGGGSAGAPDMGSAGMPIVEAGTGGTGTAGGGEVTGGAAGAPPVILPDPELLFSVKPGSYGLADTALRAQTNPENVIYTSNTGSQNPVDGSNAVKITGAELGLADTDQIVAFAIRQAEPANPVYLFSVADGAEGGYSSTRVYQAYWDENGTEEGNVYFSEGTQSFRYQGEGGDQYGYNAMTATDVSLGLTAGDFTDPEQPHAPDDLTGLAVHDANQPITELYFTVSSVAAGVTDSAVATVDATERSCTVFKSSLDGKNSVAFSCADLGLVANDQIDALAVYGDASPSDVVFSVSSAAVGVAGTAVHDAYLADDRTGSMLFESKGNQTNTLLKTARDLGLSEYTYDEIDGLAVVDAPLQPTVAHAASCTPTYDPLGGTTGGALTYVNGSVHIGDDVLVMFGQTATPTARLIAYRASDCSMLQQKDMPAGFESPYALTIVQMPGWSQANPLNKVEYYRLANVGISQELQHFDVAGAPAGTYAVNNTDYVYANGLIYEPVSQKLYGVSSQSQALTMEVMALPGVDDTTIDPEFHTLTLPCNQDALVNGTDALGNLYLVQPQAGGMDYKVCAYSPQGQLQPGPYNWASDTQFNQGGFVVPGGAHVLLHSSAAPISIESGAPEAP